jgi:hypothetical protein
MDKLANPDKAKFISGFDDVFRWLAKNGKLGRTGRHESELGKKTVELT